MKEPPIHNPKLDGRDDFTECGRTGINQDGLAERVDCPKPGVDGQTVYVYLPLKGVLAVTNVEVIITSPGIVYCKTIN